MSKSVCFVMLPFGKKPDESGRVIDFEAIYDRVIEPAVEKAGLVPLRSDREGAAGIVHKAMFERLIMSEFAIADVTVPNANVFYELGVRHSTRPQATVLVSAATSRLPFDIAALSTTPYSLNAGGRPNKVEADRALLTKRLEQCKEHHVPDSPVFKLMDGFAAPVMAHEKTDVFQRSANENEAFKQRIREAKTKDVAALDALRDGLGDLRAAPQNVVRDLLHAYRSLSAWDRMISLRQAMHPSAANTVEVCEQYAFALNRDGRGVDAEHVLNELIKNGRATSETFGLLGGIHKGRWRRARDGGDPVLARSHLRRAFSAYRQGFEADWRDSFPGVNAATLAEILDPGGAEVRALTPVVRYAAERKIARGVADYWDHATLLEIAVLDRDENRIEHVWGDVLAEIGNIDGWSARSTGVNLADIARAREAKGEDVSMLKAIIARLAPETPKPPPAS